MTKRPSFRLAILTGGSSGIGLAVAERLVGEGTSVVLMARRPELLMQAAERLEFKKRDKAEIHTVSLDVSDASAVRQGVTQILQNIGTPDLVYCGAGMTHTNHFAEITREQFQAILTTNVGGIWNVLSSVLPSMRERGEGTVVTVSSVSGLVGTYGYSAYAASKFGVMGLSQVLRNELKPDGIRVKVLCPPDTNTPQLEEERLTMPEETRKINGMAGCKEPEEIAEALMKGLRKRRFVILPGFMSKVTWYLYRWFPGFVHLIIDSDVRRARKAK